MKSTAVPFEPRFMRRAIALAKRAEGLTRPNPPVGAVVVKNGRIIGEGYHHGAGQLHAERNAFAAIKPGAAKGATLYVTLEPCSTHGRQPPCTDAILEAGVQHVFFGTPDPNPRHAGAAIPLLQKCGITISQAPEPWAAACADLLAPFTSTMLRKRPLLLLKLGLTLDGRIADSTHASHWITSPPSRAIVQAMRRASDAIMVGAGTVRHDNPSLLPRPARGRAPWRVVVAGSAPLPLNAQIFADGRAAQTIVAAPNGWHPECAAAIRATDATVWYFPKRKLLPRLLERLTAERGVMRVLCEGGGGLAGALLTENLVDELDVFLSPLLLGGPVGATGAAQWPITTPPRFTLLATPRRIGPDLFLRYAPMLPA